MRFTRRRGALAATACALAVVVSATAAEGEWSPSGSLSTELRWFPQSPAFEDQLDGVQASAAAEPELRWRSAAGRHRLEFAAFGRYDQRDDQRTHVDLREGAYRYVGNRLELLAGVSRVFWGVTESRHLVDVINQTDLVEDVDEEEKLGQPMVRLALDRAWGRLELFSLPGFRERTFPGPDGRLRPPLPIDTDRAVYESGAKNGRVDWALRWSHFLGSWDLGVHLFTGTGREPQLLPAPDGERLMPLYRLTNQAGIDVQHTRGTWLWKLEAIGREGQGATFAAAVAGFERTLYRVGGSAADLGLLAELLWDGRDSTAPATIYDNDTFLGLRLALNDVRGTEVLAGVVVDNQDASAFGLLEAGRRLGRNFTLELEARLFRSTEPEGDLAAFDRDSFLSLRATWHW